MYVCVCVYIGMREKKSEKERGREYKECLDEGTHLSFLYCGKMRLLFKKKKKRERGKN